MEITLKTLRVSIIKIRMKQDSNKTEKEIKRIQNMTLYVTLYHITRSLRKINQNQKNTPHILYNH